MMRGGERDEVAVIILPLSERQPKDLCSGELNTAMFDLTLVILEHIRWG